MKITKVDVFAADFPFKKDKDNTSAISLGTWNTCLFVLVKVHTDEGICGWGESAPFARTSPLGQMAICDVIVDYLAPAIIGMDPFNIQGIWKAMDKSVPDHPQAKGALDMALYDIMGRKLGLPASTLMGGAVRTEIPLQALLCLDTIENMKKEAEDWLDKGFRTIRIKLGTGDMHRDMAMVREIRKTIGPDIKLRVDPNQAYTKKQALQLIPVLEENEVEIFEQPVAWHDLDAMADLNASTWIPIMPHEGMKSIYDVREFIKKDAVSLFTLKTDRPGGLTKACLTRDMAELFNIPCVVMSSVELSISTCASMMLAATLKELPFACEASGPVEIEDITDNSGFIKGDKFIVPQGPGFGFEVDEDKIRHYTKKMWTADETSEIKD